MGIGYFFLPSLAGELNDVEERLQRRITRHREQRSSDRVRIAELEADLGRVALLARALAELCLSNGVVTKAELICQLEEVDLADGKHDQRLHAKFVLPGESGTVNPDANKNPPVRKPRIKRRRPYS